MIYVINKSTFQVFGCFSSIYAAKTEMKLQNLNELEYDFAEVQSMKYVSRIVNIENKLSNEKQCIYNNVNFWQNQVWIDDIANNFDNYKMTDILGKEVSYNRFLTERLSNLSRISQIDGRPGQIEYNIEVGNEFISLFREECILTDFKSDSNTSPMIIFKKLETVIAMVQVGAFREAKQALIAYREQIKDDFLTDERIDKYIDMLSAADSIEYATAEDYFYTVPSQISGEE